MPEALPQLTPEDAKSSDAVTAPIPGDDTVTVNSDGSVTIELIMPLQPTTEAADPFATLEKIRLRPMYAKDLIVMDTVDGEVGRIVAVLSALTGLPKVAIGRLHPDDYVKLFGIVRGRLGKFLLASESYSQL